MEDEYKTYNITVENNPVEWVRIREDNHGAVVGCHYIEHPHIVEFMRLTATGTLRGKLVINTDKDAPMGYTAKILMEGGVTLPLHITNINIRY
jgi:hypothetical protein